MGIQQIPALPGEDRTGMIGQRDELAAADAQCINVNAVPAQACLPPGQRTFVADQRFPGPLKPASLFRA
jgi:hypothetical protein